MTNPKFYQLTRTERLAWLVAHEQLSAEDAAFLAQQQPLSDEIAGSMIENQIGQYQLPIGVVQDVVVNGQTYQVPMVVEEPSVIAAANNAAKMVRLNGGFQTHQQQRTMLGEVVLTDLPDLKVAQNWVLANQDLLMQIAQSQDSYSLINHHKFIFRLSWMKNR